MTKAAIITPTWNNSDYTLRCLQALKEHTADFVFIWIDNGSTDAERARVGAEIERLEIPHSSIMNPTNLGYSKAVNQGLRLVLAGDFDPIVMLNNDVRVTPRWLEKLRHYLDRYERLGAVGPIPDNGLPGWDYFKKYVGYRSGDPATFINSRHPQLLPKTMVPFSCAVIRRRVIEKVGFLDESFSPCLGEDNDYNDRIAEAGWALGYALDTFIFHNHRTTCRQLPGFKAIRSRNELLLEKKRAARAAGRRA